MKATRRWILGVAMGSLVLLVSSGPGESIFTASSFLVKIEPLPLAEELYYAFEDGTVTGQPPDVYYGNKVAEGYVVVENRGREVIDLDGLAWLVQAFSEPAYNRAVIAGDTEPDVVIWPPPFPTYYTHVSPIEESVVHPNTEVAVARFEVYLQPVYLLDGGDEEAKPQAGGAGVDGSDPTSPIYQSPDTRIVIRACPQPEELDGWYRRICSTRIVCIRPQDPATWEILNAVGQAEANTAAAIGDVDRVVKTNQGLLRNLYRLLFWRPR